MQSKLDSNRRLYEMLVKEMNHGSLKVSLEDRIRKARQVAKFAMMNFTGLLSDFRVEKVIIDSGRELNRQLNFKKKDVKTEKRKVLHIASQLFNTGGHTRIIRNWIQMDEKSMPSLIVTSQSTFLEFSVQNELMSSCEQLVFLNAHDSFVERGMALKKYLIEKSFDLVILHHHPDDVIPVLALASENAPPVIYFNHADHLFSVGISVSDTVAHFRHVASKFAIEYRGVEKSVYLRYPLRRSSIRSNGRTVESKVTFVTMASFYKYLPFKGHDFFRTFASILKDNPRAEMWIIGVSEDKFREKFNYPVLPNMHFIGEVTDPREYIDKADYFVEPFPVGTGLGTIDFLQHGVVPVFNYFDATIYGKGAISLFDEMDTKEQQSLDDYRQHICDLINKKEIDNPSEYSMFLESCYNPQWSTALEDIYIDAINRGHKVRSFTTASLECQSAINWTEFYSGKCISNIRFVLSNVECISISDKKYLLTLLFKEFGFRMFFSSYLLQVALSVVRK